MLRADTFYIMQESVESEDGKYRAVIREVTLPNPDTDAGILSFGC